MKPLLLLLTLATSAPAQTAAQDTAELKSLELVRRLDTLLSEGNEQRVIELIESQDASRLTAGQKRYWSSSAYFQLGDKAERGNQHAAVVDAYTKAFDAWGRDASFPGIPGNGIRSRMMAASRMNALARAQSKLGYPAAAKESWLSTHRMLPAVLLVGDMPDRSMVSDSDIKTLYRLRAEAQAGYPVR